LGEALKPEAAGGSFGGTESPKRSKGSKVGLLVTLLNEARGSLAGIPAAQKVFKVLILTSKGRVEKRDRVKIGSRFFFIRFCDQRFGLPFGSNRLESETAVVSSRLSRTIPPASE